MCSNSLTLIFQSLTRLFQQILVGKGALGDRVCVIRSPFAIRHSHHTNNKQGYDMNKREEMQICIQLQNLTISSKLRTEIYVRMTEELRIINKEANEAIAYGHSMLLIQKAKLSLLEERI